MKYVAIIKKKPFDLFDETSNNLMDLMEDYSVTALLNKDTCVAIKLKHEDAIKSYPKGWANIFKRETQQFGGNIWKPNLG